MTLAELLRGITRVLNDAGLRTDTLEDLTEGVNDLPQVQVYPESGGGNSGKGTAAKTFGGAVQQETYQVNVDVYARQRSHLGEDMAKLVELADAVAEVLRREGRQNPAFGVDGVRGFTWRMERVTFQYGEQTVHYAGLRFLVDVTVF